MRFFTKRLVLAIHLVVAALFLLSCLVPMISPVRFWPMELLGLLFPLLLVLILAFAIFWLLLDARYSLISVALLLAGWKLILVLFAFHFSGGNPLRKDPKSITILSYNVHYFRPFDDKPDKDNLVRTAMLKLIADQHPDIACFQEFSTSNIRGKQGFDSLISDRLGLPYRFFSSDYNSPHYHSGVILFSRFPILNTGKISLMGSLPSESLIYADLLDGTDTFRVVTMHLQSIYLNHHDLEDIDQLKSRGDSALEVSRTVISKIKRASIRRGLQAVRVAAEVGRSPYPVIVCGDFNDTPDSYTYFRIRGKLQDAFLEKGWGIGRTYMGISPTLRIDFILPDRHFRVNSFKRIPRNLSDHYPIICNLSRRELGRSG